MNTRTNQHPADALADVRSEIKLLEAREQALRAHLLASDDRTGAEWQADVRCGRQHRLDRVALVKAFGRAVLKPPFFKVFEFEQVYLKRRRTRGDT